MGSTTCQEILRSLCSNTDWKYAVFWKLNHRSRMVLTLEDAYYDSVITKDLHGGQQAHDSLGLAVANMSYHVYSLGEGIVGQVAVSGEHQWVFPECYNNCHSPFEFHNVWESQMSAGIKTILVVAVGTCGVVQLGSLCKVNEDATLVNHIRHLFLALKDPLADHAANLVQYNMNNASSSRLLMEKAAQVSVDHGVVQGSTSESYSGVTFGFPTDLVDAKDENQVATNIFSGAMTSGYSDPSIHLYMKNQMLSTTSLSSLAVEADRLITDQSYPGLNSTFHASSSTDTDHMLETKGESSRLDALISSGYTFPGSELLEALGSAFKQTSSGHEEQVKSEHGSAIRSTDDMSHSQLTIDSGPENLLDAVVANVCHGDGNARDDIWSSRSVQSLLTSMEMTEPSGRNKHIFVNPMETQQTPSDICGAFSSIGFSSTCPSSSSDHFQTSLETPKKNKKRAKPGESSRPRPRDRQLIQDRIKELRDLVPNGSKCSIDSLLERTIKHMLFLQNVTKHADKLSKSANTKMQQQKETGTQGSSCAVEVGGHLQVCSIIVENLNKQGMVLIEMLCEECSHFLEIANVIKSLDLIILRGITEAQGEKTWICFVVEGQNNKVMQRMDILWSLVQIFQPKGNAKR